MLLQEAVSQDGQRGEADVVHRQIGRIIQGLGAREQPGKVKADRSVRGTRRDGAIRG